MKKQNVFITAILATTLTPTLSCWAGTEMKWADVPAAVRATVLAHGGKEGQSVDQEETGLDGQAIYEAAGKDKDGNNADLEVRADGKLIEVKHGDEPSAGEQRAARAEKVLAGVKFSHPRRIDNTWLPLAKLKQDVIEGSEDGKKTRVERTLKPEVHKTFKVAGQTVESLCMEDRIFVNGVIEEVALDYFAQDDGGTVYYLGEDVDEYDSTASSPSTIRLMMRG